MTYLGHKEDAPAKEVAESLASALNTKVIAVAGMHWENITPNELTEVASLLDELKLKLLAELKPIPME